MTDCDHASGPPTSHTAQRIVIDLRARRKVDRSMRGRLVWLSLCAATTALEAPAHADTQPDIPPPTTTEYLQYGVGLVVETMASAGDVCPRRAQTPCILGSGLGLAIRAGYRSQGPWYAGGAYEVSRHDPNNLLRLAILQQLRGEVRYYLDRGTRLTPALAGGLGATVYGNEFGAETGGLTLHLGVLAELQLSRTTVIGVGAGYRPLLLRGWTDSAGQRRADRYLGFGLAHAVSLEFTLELRDPLARW